MTKINVTVYVGAAQILFALYKPVAFYVRGRNNRNRHGKEQKSCFVVSADMRRKGVARRLLEFACNDAANKGFEFVEAYPNREFRNESKDFMGPVSIYNELGFSICGEVDRRWVMRKKLLNK